MFINRRETTYYKMFSCCYLLLTVSTATMGVKEETLSQLFYFLVPSYLLPGSSGDGRRDSVGVLKSQYESNQVHMREMLRRNMDCWYVHTFICCSSYIDLWDTKADYVVVNISLYACLATQKTFQGRGYIVAIDVNSVSGKDWSGLFGAAVVW